MPRAVMSRRLLAVACTLVPAGSFAPTARSNRRLVSACEMLAEYESMSYRELQRACKDRGLRAVGRAPELLERLRAEPPPAALCVDGGDPSFGSHAELVAALHELRGDPLDGEAHGSPRMVTHRGPASARVAVIGEAPGADEDRLGEPFVGRAGRLLDEMFTCAGFAREELYVTNLVKRRPPANRDPTPAEIAFYAPWLMEELRLVAPRIVVTTGRLSMRAVLSEPRPISRVRGTWYAPDALACGAWGMPIFHPAYLLRNPSPDPGTPKSRTWHDVQEIRRKFDELAAG